MKKLVALALTLMTALGGGACQPLGGTDPSKKPAINPRRNPGKPPGINNP